MIKQLTIATLQLANNLILAPMAGITNGPVRLLSRECGAALCFTEMVSVNGIAHDGRKSLELMASSESDRPLGVQLFGDDPALLAEGARVASAYGDLIDINMGCPVKKVVNSGSGSALLREPAKVRDIVRAVRSATCLPLTIKIRSGWQAEDRNFPEIARIAEGEGCDAITLHPRSRSQMFDGKADWQHLAELKQLVTIPVIGSGDLFSAQDVVSMLGQTGCDGVMIARGSLGNPWIFRETLQLLAGQEPTGPTREERLNAALGHIASFIACAGETVAIREMRKHLCWYVKGLPGASRFRDFVNRIDGKQELIAGVTDFFRQQGDWVS
ncbi:tRNA dihydrouridine synthase DusB [Geobacter pelophilus]|uniref:tRNA-dihydrouridine synthase n=1 Tax=Geoanaerobacter pelophilus TaxID=60036 RepID=A0AAW4L352_9BACT|nr:tRNA dihydrouridine synthase DusB [Geoanaerobacter pelophilus]MBT0665416.1 tRNA dihydrouridine synthase DusB [Geoanaerobacter pelophilus]